MLSHNYSYQQVLDNSIKVAWTIDQVLGGKNFDLSKPFLPDTLVGTNGIACLSDEEKLTFNQITGNSYCNLFAFVEEFLVALVVNAARDGVLGDEVRLRSLLRFSEEEVKHQDMFTRATKLFATAIGVECDLITGREDVARAVLGTSPLCGMLLGSMLEWITQSHYLEHIRDTEELDVLMRDMLRHHWIDEAQHTKVDSLIIDEIVADSALEDRETAVDQLLALLGAVDGLLGQQVAFNVATLERVTGRTLSADDKAAVMSSGHKAFRWGFLVVGLQHPKFTQIVKELTEMGPAKIAEAAQIYSAAP